MRLLLHSAIFLGLGISLAALILYALTGESICGLLLAGNLTVAYIAFTIDRETYL